MSISRVKSELISPGGTSPVSLRGMNRSDIAAGLRLCRACHWNQIEDDWRGLLDFDRAGGHVASHGENVVGTACFLRYGGVFSWIAMMLVDPEARRTGIASLLMEAALESLREESCVRLDATPAGEPLYRRFGFADECPLVRMRAVVDQAVVARPGGVVRRMEPADLPEVFHRDLVVFGADRSALLASLYRRAPELARVSKHGYCFGRPGYSYYQLGPIVAEDAEIAAGLASHCLSTQQGTQFAIDAPKHSPDWIAWLESAGFQIERPFLRMQRGSNDAQGAPDRQFGIAGPEFG